MKISIETYVMRERFGDETAIKMIKEAGFDCYDYSMYSASKEHDMLGEDYLERAKMLRKFADEIGIECNQAHSPFEIGYGDSFEISDKKYLRLVRSIESASVLGANTVIVHAIKDNIPENVDFYELNRDFYKSLLPYSEKFGICISVENLFNSSANGCKPVLSDPTEHISFVKSLNSDAFNICVDVGHSAITGYKPQDVISAMNSGILKALHIHDNDLINDLHLIPYAGKLDWKEILSSLKKIGYDGELTFEIFGHLGKIPDDIIADSLRYAASIGIYFVNKLG